MKKLFIDIASTWAAIFFVRLFGVGPVWAVGFGVIAGMTADYLNGRYK